MIEKQEGKCAICECELKFVGNQSVVDHCHKTHVIRGILCRACNTAIGLLKENDKHFRRAMQYLSDAQAKGVQPEKVRGVYGYIRDWYAEKASGKTKTGCR